MRTILFLGSFAGGLLHKEVLSVWCNLNDLSFRFYAMVFDDERTIDKRPRKARQQSDFAQKVANKPPLALPSRCSFVNLS